MLHRVPKSTNQCSTYFCILMKHMTTWKIWWIDVKLEIKKVIYHTKPKSIKKSETDNMPLSGNQYMLNIKSQCQCGHIFEPKLENVRHQELGRVRDASVNAMDDYVRRLGRRRKRSRYSNTSSRSACTSHCCFYFFLWRSRGSPFWGVSWCILMIFLAIDVMKWRWRRINVVIEEMTQRAPALATSAILRAPHNFRLDIRANIVMPRRWEPVIFLTRVIAWYRWRIIKSFNFILFRV